MTIQRDVTTQREHGGEAVVQETHLNLHRDGDNTGLENTLYPVDETTESPTVQRWQQLRCYGFRVGPHRLMVSQGTYCELLTQPQLALLPNAPAHVLGITSVRGNLIPVYRLEPLLELEIQATSYALVIGKVGSGAALAIGHKPAQLDLTALNASETPPDQPELLKSVVTATYEEAGNVWSTFNHEQLFLKLANA